jgi:ketosteroid isomerase-like protein
MYRALAALALCLSLPAFAQQPPSVAPQHALERVLRDYEAGWEAGDNAAVAKLFTTDGFALPNGKPAARGHEAIRDAYMGSKGALRLRALAYSTADTVGYIIGAYAYGQRNVGDIGKFVLALRKDSTGRWLIAADIDNAIR